MKKCCKETFKLSIEQVLLIIIQNKITGISTLINTLSWVIEILEKEEK